MIAELKAWTDAIEKSYQFYVYLFTLFVICMGVARWYGKKTWRKSEEARRTENGLPIASFVSGTDLEKSFTYSGLFQGGLVGLYVVVTLFTFVLFMPLSLYFIYFVGGFLTGSPEPSARMVSGGVWILMFFPIFMGGFFFLLVFGHRDRVTIRNCAIPLGVTVLCWIAAITVAWVLPDKNSVVASQIAALLILSLPLSYFVGMADGIGSADPSTNYPLVNVELIRGKGFDRVWLYERTDSDYRFVAANGSNHIVPAVNVARIGKAAGQPAS